VGLIPWFRVYLAASLSVALVRKLARSRRLKTACFICHWQFAVGLDCLVPSFNLSELLVCIAAPNFQLIVERRSREAFALSRLFDKTLCVPLHCRSCGADHP
jgi:hypothetical protein